MPTSRTRAPAFGQQRHLCTLTYLRPYTYLLKKKKRKKFPSKIEKSKLLVSGALLFFRLEDSLTFVVPYIELYTRNVWNCWVSTSIRKRDPVKMSCNIKIRRYGTEGSSAPRPRWGWGCGCVCVSLTWAPLSSHGGILVSLCTIVFLMLPSCIHSISCAEGLVIFFPFYLRLPWIILIGANPSSLIGFKLQVC